MAVTPILETDTLNQGRIKINEILEQSNQSTQTVAQYETRLEQGINESKQIAATAGNEAIRIAEDATVEIQNIAEQANTNSTLAMNNSRDAVAQVNTNKQEMDRLRNDFDKLVAEAGDSNPEIVQARTDMSGVTQTTLAQRLTVDFNNYMTSADSIALLSGSTPVKKMMDFTGKTQGNVSTNPHIAYLSNTTKTLNTPTSGWSEVDQTGYGYLVARDDRGVATSTNVSGNIPQFMFTMDVPTAVETLAPSIFEGMSVAEVVAYIKSNFVSMTLTLRGKASSPNNKNVNLSIWDGSSWDPRINKEGIEYAELNLNANDTKYIDDNGKVFVIAYSDSSNGVTPSSIDIDYVGVAIDISMNAQDVLTKAGFVDRSEIQGFASQEDLDAHTIDQSNPHQVTKSQVGLGDVPNYSVASNTEAIEGVAGNKFITPEGVNSFYVQKTKTRRQRWDEGLNWIAHRGNNSTYPENSKLAFITAYNHWGIETDIQVTSDGQWVCMHDSTVDRTTNGTGTVASKTLAQFRALRIDTGGDGTNLQALSDADKIPPTFDEYLQICKQMNKVPIIEIKDYAYTATHYDLLRSTLTRWGYDETNCVIGTFSYDILVKIRGMYPNMELHYFVRSINSDVINQITVLGVPAALSVSYSHATVTESNVGLVHTAGFKFALWSVPETSFSKMIGLGVDYITTDSKSGNLRWEKLTLLNGFTGNSVNQRMNTNFVQEIGGGIIHLEFNVLGGTNTQGTSIAQFPDWANPMYLKWNPCVIRSTSGGVLGSFDLNGRNLQGSRTGEVGTIAVGLNWKERSGSGWATGSTTYKVN